jgi:hypothetical protein
MTTSEILKAARARLTPETWGKGDGTNDAMRIPANRSCVAMAVSLCGGYDFIDALHLLSCVMTGEYEGDIPSWNDAPERTLQDVHDALDAAIAIAKQQEAASVLEHGEAVAIADARSSS